MCTSKINNFEAHPMAPFFVLNLFCIKSCFISENCILLKSEEAVFTKNKWALQYFLYVDWPFCVLWWLLLNSMTFSFKFEQNKFEIWPLDLDLDLLPESAPIINVEAFYTGVLDFSSKVGLSTSRSKNMFLTKT